MRRFAIVSGVIVCSLTASPVLVGQSGPPPLTPFRGLIDVVSAPPSGWTTLGGSSESTVHALSGDGRYVAFQSSVTDLVPDDTNWQTDVFLRDRSTGVTSRVSMPDAGGESNGNSWTAAISANGRHVAFASGATNLVAGDTNNMADVFVRDLDANRTVRVSVTGAGTQGEGESYSPAISADGRFVVFVSNSAAFDPAAVPYGPHQVYLHDRDVDADGIFDEAGTTALTRVSVAVDGGLANQQSTRPHVSANGRFVVFESDATNLDPPGYSNNRHHLFRYDRSLGQTTLVDQAVTGGPSSDGVSWGSADMSDDGRFVTYTSMSWDLAPNASAYSMQVYRYDASSVGTMATTVVSLRSDGVYSDGFSYYSAVSGDGRYVAFMTSSTNLAGPAPLNNGYGIVVADTLEGAFTRADVVDGGAGFDGQYTQYPSLSADGTAVAFASDAPNAINGGGFPGGASNVFVATAFSASVPAVLPQEGGAGSIDVNTTAVSGWDASVPSFHDWIVLTDGAAYAAGPRTLQFAVGPNPGGILRTGQVRVGSTWVTIRQAGDGDTSPPQITPIVSGTQAPSGWFTSDVTVSWAVSDPDSEIVGQSWNCTNPVTIASDTIYAPITCEATSHGGANAVTFVVRRDTTPPSVSLTQPVATIYQMPAMPSYSCQDTSGYSGVATCVGTLPQDGWIDTTAKGRHVFTVTATDLAGNTASKSLEYIVGPGACAAPPAVPAHLSGWWRLDASFRDVIRNRDAVPSVSAGSWQSGVALHAWFHASPNNFLSAGEAPATIAGQGLTVAAWVRPQGNSGTYGTIVSNPLQYHVARYSDGTLRWAFNTTAGFEWVNTGAQLSALNWSHVAVAYKDGHVLSYVNGRLVHDAALNGTLTTSGNPAQTLTIGGRAGVAATLYGMFDEVMIFDDALSAAEIDSVALAGGSTLCRLATGLTLTAPPTVVYGTTFQVSATLADGAGRPLANRNVTLTSVLSPGVTHNKVTDANGLVTAQFAIAPSMTVGQYPNAITAAFAADATLDASTARADVTLAGATPALTWAQPASIAYGAPLGAAQLNASATLPGSLVYSPAAGTVLDAGAHTLSVTFTPDDAAHWAPRTLTTTLVVNKAAPTVEFPGAPLFYNAQPRQALVFVRGVGGVELNPFTVLYDGGTTLPVNAGAYALQVSYAGSVNYEPVTANGSLVINKATPIMGTFGDMTVTYDGQPHGISTNVAGFEGWLTPVVVTYNGSATMPVNAGVYTVEARYEGSANYNPVSHAATLTIVKATPSVTWSFPGGGVTYGTPVGATQLNATSDVPGTFAYSPEAGTVLPAGTHTLTATFTPEDPVNYETVTASRSLTVSKANPTVSWPAPAPIVYGTPLGAAQLNATANTSGTFTYSQPAGTVLNAGTHVVTVNFTPDDTANYNAAPSMGVPIVVTKATPSISWFFTGGITYGTALDAAQLNATADVPGTFSYEPGAGTVLGAGTHTLTAAFTPADPANYEALSVSRSMFVAKVNAFVMWDAPAPVVYGTPLGETQLNATGSVPGTLTYSPAAGTVLPAGTHTLTATFTPADPANHEGATATRSITVTPAAPVITWDAPASIGYGTPLSATQLNATASVNGALTYSPAAGTVLGAGSHTLSVTFVSADDNYGGGTASVTITVTKASPTITWGNPAGIVYGTALSAAQLNAAANVEGTFTYSPAIGTVLPAGSQTLSMTFTPSDAANYSTEAGSVTLQVARATPAIGWPFLEAIQYGTPLGPGQLSATATIGGTFSYSATAGTVLNAGSHVLSATFQPADIANYTTATESRVLNVSPAELKIRPTDVTKPFGAPVPPLVATALGFVNGDSMASLSGSLVVSSPATASSQPGTYAITASGVSSPNYSIVFQSGVLGVVPASTATSVTVSPNPVGLNQPLTLTASVAVVAPGAGAPSGSVTFFDNGTAVGVAPLSGGTASLTTNGLTAGSHTVSALYSGDANFATSSVNGTFAIKSSAASSTTVVTSSSNPSSAGQTITLTATVTAPSGLSGSVAFYDGATHIGTATLSGTTARLFNVSLAAGGHAITARYLGNATIPPSVSPALAQYVRQGGSTRTSTVALVASPSPAVSGGTVTLTATVTGSQNDDPTGVVLFMANGFVLGQGTLTRTGNITAVATFQTAQPRGVQRVEAVYLGDTTFRASKALISLTVF